MPFAFSSPGASDSSPSRPVVAGLFVASCLLALVSWYTTFEGMRLYLNVWFALLASAGIQVSLVLVAWLVGFGRARRALLMAVYAVTACVSIAFSYVSLYTWFAERERPAEIQRGLYDKISTATGAAGEILSGAALEARRHVAALTEMAEAEKSVGHISRAQDADPYLASIRDAVSTEARTYGVSYQEGAGAGLRYTAFERYAKLTRQSLEQIEASQKALAGLRAQLKPTQSSEEQLRAFRQVYDSIPWAEAERQLHSGPLKRPEVPDYASNLDKTSGGQEDLLLAFAALGAPNGRHLFALLLAAFIDVIIFLIAYASGPYLAGSSEHRLLGAAATLESLDGQVFVRDFLRKLEPDASGMLRVAASTLNAGERQLCTIFVAHGRAVISDVEGRTFFVLEPATHESLLDQLARPNASVRMSARSAAAGA